MHDFGKIVAPTMCELFVRRLADMILSGELRAGEHLPPERQLPGIIRGKALMHRCRARKQRTAWKRSPQRC